MVRDQSLFIILCCDLSVKSDNRSDVILSSLPESRDIVLTIYGFKNETVRFFSAFELLVLKG